MKVHLILNLRKIMKPHFNQLVADEESYLAMVGLIKSLLIVLIFSKSYQALLMELFDLIQKFNCLVYLLFLISHFNFIQPYEHLC